MGIVQTIRNWISSWRGSQIPSATVDFWNADQFELKDLRGVSDELRLQIEAFIEAQHGVRYGLLRKRWVLPIDALDELRQLIPGATVAPPVLETHGRTQEQRTRFALSSAKALDEVPYQLSDFGIEMYPFQHAAVAYLLRAKQCVLGDEAGVGKTFPAIAAAHLVREPGASTIVICPANLKLNWASEIKRARPNDSMYICYGQSPKETPSSDWVILNYDIATYWMETLRKVKSNVVILDEVHNCKNPSAQRSAACLRIADGKPYRFGLTGTLFRNRHAEAFYPLRVLGQLEPLGGHPKLLREYCDGSEGLSVNSEGFNKLLRSHCYVRREKREVLTQLPAKTRAHLVVDIDNRKRYTSKENDLIAWLRRVRLDPAAWKSSRVEAVARMNQLRQLTGTGKIPAAVDWIQDFLEQSEHDDKLVVFAHHRKVQAGLLAAFPDALHLMANDSMQERQLAKEQFQNDPTQRLIICSLHVASEGITLTAASTLLCVELDYVPAMLFDQMEGRIDRNGQTRPTQVYYLLAENSIDQRMMRLLESKWRIVTAANTGQTMQADASIFDELVDGFVNSSATEPEIS